MTRKISARLERLEQHIGASPDLAGEAERYGTCIWSTAGVRAYGHDAPAGARLAVVGPHGGVVYELAGMALGDLR
ncbi:hypothetical protein [Streptomyces sp. NPDC088812]|uniref:hypothetical protein n=1 Tax=Streptomyces sp. NPDC088812 TaxID=3365905 RepID=UPI003800F36B